MARFEVRIKRSAVKEIEAVSHKKDRRRIVERIRLLAENPPPPGCRKLSGRNRYRVRQGPYRIIYAVEDAMLTVYVVKVGHRGDVYRGT